MGAKPPSAKPLKLRVHPALYRRVRQYRDRISQHSDRPRVAAKFVEAVEDLVLALLANPHRGHLAGFDDAELADVWRIAVPGFAVFAVFYRCDGKTLTVITLEHTAQNLPARLAAIVAQT